MGGARRHTPAARRLRPRRRVPAGRRKEAIGTHTGRTRATPQCRGAPDSASTDKITAHMRARRMCLPTAEARPDRWTVALPARLLGGQTKVMVCAEANEEITDAHWRRSRGEGDALDGHALYTRLKVAAALAVLDGHLGAKGVTAEDWRLAGVLMAVSDATRADVQADLCR